MRDRFEQLLKDAIGLEAASIGSAAVERAVRARMTASGAANLDAYWQIASESDVERQALVEEVVVPETWFFRDREVFAGLVRLLQQDLTPWHPDGVFRLLSAPCATGEEPYSMAMALSGAGMRPDRFRVDGIDVSERALAAAARAVYGRNSFRGGDLGFRDRFFQPSGDRFALDASIRERVRLRHANLFAPGLQADLDRYDVIFCRNLLIYFDRPTQDRAIHVLEQVLAPQGALFVGASETSVFVDRPFRSVRLPMAFAFRRSPAASPAPPRPPAPVSTFANAGWGSGRPPAGAAMRAGLPAARETFPPVLAARAPLAATPARDLLDDARRLADRGRFAEAATCCEARLAERADDVDALYLLGLVRDASGNHADAERCYRRALYVDPQHLDTLVHLALLVETQGRAAEADVLRKRVRRLQPDEGARG